MLRMQLSAAWATAAAVSSLQRPNGHTAPNSAFSADSFDRSTDSQATGWHDCLTRRLVSRRTGVDFPRSNCRKSFFGDLERAAIFAGQNVDLVRNTGQHITRVVHRGVALPAIERIVGLAFGQFGELLVCDRRTLQEQPSNRQLRHQVENAVRAEGGDLYLARLTPLHQFAEHLTGCSMSFLQLIDCRGKPRMRSVLFDEPRDVRE